MPIMRQDINFDGNQNINFGQRPKTRKKWVQILKCDMAIVVKSSTQHDEVEPNLKKNPPQKRNMGFGGYCHVVSITNLKKNPIP